MFDPTLRIYSFDTSRVNSEKALFSQDAKNLKEINYLRVAREVISPQIRPSLIATSCGVQGIAGPSVSSRHWPETKQR